MGIGISSQPIIKTQTAIDRDHGKTNHEIVRRRTELVEKWNPSWEMYPLRFGPAALAACASLTALPIMLHYRKFLNLRTTGILTSTVATLLMPGAVVGGVQYGTVTEPILSGRMMCPVCYEVRSAVIQIVGGTFFPLVSTSTMSMFLALSHKTEAVPHVRYYKEVWAFWRKMNRNISTRLLWASGLSAAAAMVVTMLQFKCMEAVWTKELHPVRERSAMRIVHQPVRPGPTGSTGSAG